MALPKILGINGPGQDFRLGTHSAMTAKGDYFTLRPDPVQC